MHTHVHIHRSRVYSSAHGADDTHAHESRGAATRRGNTYVLVYIHAYVCAYDVAVTRHITSGNVVGKMFKLSLEWSRKGQTDNMT